MATFWAAYVECVGGIVVSIAAFQAVDPGSIPGRRIVSSFIFVYFFYIAFFILKFLLPNYASKKKKRFNLGSTIGLHCSYFISFLRQR